MQKATPKLPFKVELKHPFQKTDEQLEHEAIERQIAWVNSIKKQARENLDREFEHLRIAWTARYKIPKYQNFNEYTLEEIILETWEQYYYENPNSLELKGVFKKVNPKTGYKYYETGDPVIDELERAFGRGETPDLDAALGHIKGGQDIFRSPVFVHSEHVIGGQASPGDTVSPRKGYQGVQENEKGEKITVAGAKVEHEDYSSDEWLKNALEDDPMLKALSKHLEG